MANKTLYTAALSHFSPQPVVTLAAGATCAYLGDERNLREFLVADETAQHLRLAGHTVFSLLIDDSFDPLTVRQLRVGVNKDEKLIAQYQDWCGKPIGLLPDPWGCHASYAAHFEHALLDRLNGLGCHFTLVSTINLYERGLYAPYVHTVLKRHDEIKAFLAQRFQGYQPEKMFWPLCPTCGYMDGTRIENTQREMVTFFCERCQQAISQPFADVRGKLNWKLDCAARWALLNVDAEPFNKAYLEPKAGAFVVAQTLCQEFFGGRAVFPLRYGLVKMERQHSYQLLASLPPAMLRHMMVERASSDLNITHEGIIQAAARFQVMPGMSFRAVIDQLVPGWLLTPEALMPAQRDLLARGVAFAEHFLGSPMRLHLPQKENFDACHPTSLCILSTLMDKVFTMRLAGDLSCEEFGRQVQAHLSELGKFRHEVTRDLRRMLGQERGLPIGLLLFMLPMSYIGLLTHLLELASRPFHQKSELPALEKAA